MQDDMQPGAGAPPQRTRTPRVLSKAMVATVLCVASVAAIFAMLNRSDDETRVRITFRLLYTQRNILTRFKKALSESSDYVERGSHRDLLVGRDSSVAFSALEQAGGDITALTNRHGRLVRRWRVCAKERQIWNELAEFGANSEEVIKSYWRVPLHVMPDRHVSMMERVSRLELYSDICRFMGLSSGEQKALNDAENLRESGRSEREPSDQRR